MWLHEIRLVYLLLQSFARKYWFSLFFTKASPTDGRTDRPTDGRTDMPGYRDARTHLKTTSSSPLEWKFDCCSWGIMKVFDCIWQQVIIQCEFSNTYCVLHQAREWGWGRRRGETRDWEEEEGKEERKREGTNKPYSISDYDERASTRTVKLLL